MDLVETTSQERLESELSSELDEVKMRDLERQLSDGLASSFSGNNENEDEVFQPSPEISRKENNLTARISLLISDQLGGAECTAGSLPLPAINELSQPTTTHTKGP
jgi:hypothetical protein